MRNGFTLVELSIVLVIIGLLVSGVLVGQNLVRASEIRGISTQIGTIVTAVQTFTDKYGAMPGDMKDATAYWGTAANCPGTDTQPSTTSATCNGDGDGYVEYFGVSTSHEMLRVWQHLGNAGLIQGTYTGVPSNSGSVTTYTPGINAYAGKVGGTGYEIDSYSNRASTDAYWWEGIYDNEIAYGKMWNSAMSAALAPAEASSIDVKLDDGKPAYGRIRSMRSTACNTTNVEATAEYAISNSAVSCMLLSLHLQQ